MNVAQVREALPMIGESLVKMMLEHGLKIFEDGVLPFGEDGGYPAVGITFGSADGPRLKFSLVIEEEEDTLFAQVDDSDDSADGDHDVSRWADDGGAGA